MLKAILGIGLLGMLFAGCGENANEERVALQQLEMLQELKESKLYRDSRDTAAEFKKITAAINAAQGEQE